MPTKLRLTKSAELESLGPFRKFIDEACASRGIDEETNYELRLAVDEACTNIITHGYAGMNPGSIILDLEFEPHQIIVRLTDFGHPFEPCEPPAPDLNAALEDRPMSGFGLFIIYGTMDQVDYQTREDGNTLILTKRLKAVPA
jgi:anti-sigma regulatory factor (Ser/Thr protein kinase)